MSFEIKPWNEKSKNKIRQLAKDGIIYTNDINFTRTIGRRYPQLFDENNGFLDIGRIGKRNKSMIAKRPNVSIIPIIKPRTTKFKFYKIF